MPQSPGAHNDVHRTKRQGHVLQGRRGFRSVSQAHPAPAGPCGPASRQADAGARARGGVHGVPRALQVRAGGGTAGDAGTAVPGSPPIAIAGHRYCTHGTAWCSGAGRLEGPSLERWVGRAGVELSCGGAYRALCARCAKSWLFSTTGRSVSSED